MTVPLRLGTAAHIDSWQRSAKTSGWWGAADHGLGHWAARGVTRVVVCGLARDFCVRWTALDAAAEGFAVVVPDDLCRAVFPEQAAVTSAALAAAGVRHMDARPASRPRSGVTLAALGVGCPSADHLIAHAAQGRSWQLLRTPRTSWESTGADQSPGWR